MISKEKNGAYKAEQLGRTLGMPILKHCAGVKRYLKTDPERIVGKTGEEPGLCGFLEVKEIEL